MRHISKMVAAVGLCGALGSISVPAAAKDISLGHVTANLQYLYNAAVAKGFTQGAEEVGAKAVILDPRGSPEAQGNAIDDLIAQKIDGMMINPLDSVVAQAWVDKVAEAKIPIIAASNKVGDPDKPLKDVYPNLTGLIVPDDVIAGQNIGEYSASLLPKDREAKIAVAEGAPGVAAARQRSEGFEAGLKKAGAKYKIVGSQPTDWTPEKGESVCQNMLTANPDIDLIFAHYDDIAIGCARAIAAAGSPAKLVSGAGGGKLGDQAIKDGELTASICTKPVEIGRMAAKALYDAATGKDTKKAELMLIDSPVITKDNLEQVCPNAW